MVDLPQHAAQISIWKHFDDACYRFADTYQFHWLTPYLAGYLFVRAFAALLTVNAALKMTIYLGVLALPLSMRFLLRKSTADAWLSLLGFPLAFGFAFYWGFLNFIFGIPVAVVYLALLYDFSLQPALRRAFVLCVLAVALLVCHGLLLLFCMIATVVLAAFVRPLSRAAIGLLPLSVSIPPLLVSLWRMAIDDPLVAHATRWDLGTFRLHHFPSMLLSNEAEVYALPFVGMAILAVAAASARPAREPRRWVFFLIAASLYLFAPEFAFGRAFIFQRFAIFVAIGALFATEEDRASSPARACGHAIVVLLVISWSLLLAQRFREFNREALEFDRIVDAMPANRRLVSYIAQPFSNAVPGAVFLHFAAYYQERKGGLTAWSFARYFPQLVRYKPGAAPPLRGGVLLGRSEIDWSGVDGFDDVVVRSPTDPSRMLAATAPFPLFPRAHSGSWWLYETPRGRNVQSKCAPLEENR